MTRLNLVIITLMNAVLAFGQVSLVKDIGLEELNGQPEQLIKNSNYLFFSAEDVNGRELWTIDETSTAALLKDINPGAKSGIDLENPQIIFNDQLLFVANNGEHGSELWMSDGTSDGTQLLKDINIGAFGSFINQFTLWNNQIYFIASNGINGVELWKTDGTSAGTTMVRDIQTGKRSGVIQIVGGTSTALFFVGNNGNNGNNGNELWKTNGTSSGTEFVKDIYEGFRGSAISKGINFNDAIYFRANDGTGHELWTSDGTNIGTKMVKDIQTTNLLGSYPDWFTIYNNALYFSADDGENGVELWMTDGTEQGTNVVADNRDFIFKNRPRHLTVFNDALYFSYNDGISGKEIWKTDGTEQGTELIRNIDGNYNANPSAFYVFGESLFFSAKTGQEGTELWSTSGTESTTELVADVNPGNKDAFPADIIEFKNGLYFTATTEENGRELFRLGDVVSSEIPTSVLNDIQLFPNPAKNFIQIENKSDIIFESIAIFNSKGQTVLSEKFGTIIDIKTLPAGSYSLQLKDLENRIGWLNFIKQ